MSVTKNTKPKWLIDENWGIGLDSLNWRLYRRKKAKKENSEDKWKVHSYYPTLAMLAKGLTQHLVLEDSHQTTLKAHLEVALETCARAIAGINNVMLNLGIDKHKYPPGYADFNLPKKEKEIPPPDLSGIDVLAG